MNENAAGFGAKDVLREYSMENMVGKGMSSPGLLVYWTCVWFSYAC